MTGYMYNLQGTGIYNGGLYIMNAQYYHRGQYTCVVESSSGTMSADADVTIIGKTRTIIMQTYTAHCGRSRCR